MSEATALARAKGSRRAAPSVQHRRSLPGRRRLRWSPALRGGRSSPSSCPWLQSETRECSGLNRVFSNSAIRSAKLDGIVFFVRANKIIDMRCIFEGGFFPLRTCAPARPPLIHIGKHAHIYAYTSQCESNHRDICPKGHINFPLHFLLCSEAVGTQSFSGHVLKCFTI
jgi:hypothetical protein